MSTPNMRIHILSDLHLEFAPFTPPAVAADVVVCAGDIHTGRNGLHWLRDAFPNVPVLYVLGNHEFYGQKIPKLTQALKSEAEGTNVTILENDSVIIENVTFLGATLWTDFKLNGDGVVSEIDAKERMTDFRRIRISPNFSRFRPVDARLLFARSHDWLVQKTSELVETRFVIVTHHSPSPQSVPGHFKGDALSPAYASNLDPFIATAGAAAWIHGHIHTPVDYHIATTRVISNPRGYPDEQGSRFNPSCVITV